MVSHEIKNIVESIIFASEEEINSRQVKEIIEKGAVRVSVGEVEDAVSTLNDEYKSMNKSFEIIKIAGGYTFATKKEYGRFIGKLFEDRQKKKLSPSALETLAIIAYKQPITRSEMEFIRGVNVDYIVNSLLEKDLITIHGRAETPGRPILYGTTKTFLKVLGLNSVEDLPKLKEINEILKNQEIEGITEADIELFNSVNNPEIYKAQEEGHQLELISNESISNENDESISNENDESISNENDESISNENDESISNENDESISNENDESISNENDESISNENDESISNENDESISNENDESISNENDESISNENDESISNENDESISNENDESISNENDESISNENDESISNENDESNSNADDDEDEDEFETENLNKVDASILSDDDEDEDEFETENLNKVDASILSDDEVNENENDKQ